MTDSDGSSFVAILRRAPLCSLSTAQAGSHSLPPTRERRQRRLSGTMNVDPRTSHGRLVLIVDDDGPTRALFARALAQAGIATLEADSGDEALELLRSRLISLVLLDSKMPGLSGAAVIERLRLDPRTAKLPVVMVTGLNGVAAKVAGLDAGADDYLEKPVDLDELVARVRSQLRRDRAWQDSAAGMRRRASMIEVLTGLPRGESAQETAVRVCTLLSEEMADIAIVAFSPDETTVLSACGALASTMPSGTVFTPKTSSRLRALSEQGPWTRPRDEGGPIGLHTSAACGVPLFAHGRLLGLLLVASSTTAAASSDLAFLSTARGVAPAISAVLAPALEQRDSQRASR
jgi:DNA-binding response OmpR family regulator